MTRRNRKLLGTLTMLMFLGAYAYLAVGLAELQALQLAPWGVQALCFGILGIGWAFPLMPLIWWMERGGDKARGTGKSVKRR